MRSVWVGLTTCAAGAMLLAGCHGGVHKKGEQQFTVSGSYGEPFGEGFGYNGGDGTGQDAALTLGYGRFLEDRVAVSAHVTPYRIYNQDGGDIYAGELQLGLRYYFWELDVLSKPMGFFAEVYGGLLYGARSIPERGSNFNFTQQTGVGLEWRLYDRWSWFAGYRMRHLSNCHLFDDDNPSQNEHSVYTGVAFTW